MTYLQFHFVFTIPVIAILAVLHILRFRRVGLVTGLKSVSNQAAYFALGLMCLVAFVYTTPWDNLLVATEVWGYGDGRVLFTVGWVPFEEYLFFLLQTILTALFFYYLSNFIKDNVQDNQQATTRNNPPNPMQSNALKMSNLRVSSTLVCLLFAALGVLALTTQAGRYYGLIAVWAFPVIAIQTAFGADLIWQRKRLVLLSIAIPTLYLWVADRIAIGLGIWWISPEQTLGIKPFGLPIEEALFFLVTNILVVCGLALALHPESRVRLAKMFRGFRPWQGLAVIWFLSMLPTPLLPQYFVPLAYVSSFLFALTLLALCFEYYGARALLLFLLALTFGFAVEWVGKTTGVPFGPYDYLPKGLSLFGVPLLVPLGWWSFSICALLVSPKRLRLWLAPLVLVAWDIGLDPLMVSQGFWKFETGAYYGIPLSNFLGWYLAGWILMNVLSWLEPRLLTDQPQSIRILFVIQIFLMTVGLLVFSLPLAAMLFLLSMLVLLIPFWTSSQGGWSWLQFQNQP